MFFEAFREASIQVVFIGFFFVGAPWIIRLVFDWIKRRKKHER